GTVRWVSPASVETPEGQQFRVLADIDANGIFVDGKRRQFLAGMSGRADVVVGHRTLASYAFDPVRQLKENMAAPRTVRERLGGGDGVSAGVRGGFIRSKRRHICGKGVCPLAASWCRSRAIIPSSRPA